jgi:hypothetical protein
MREAFDASNFAAGVTVTESRATCSMDISSSEIELEAVNVQGAESTDGLRDCELNWESNCDIAIGIMYAGGIYPMVAGAIVGLVIGGVQLVNILSGQVGAQASDWFGVVMGTSSFAAMAACFGLVWALFVASLTGPVVYFFARFLRYRGSIVWYGAFWGGLVGFLAAFPVPALVVANVTSLEDIVLETLAGIAIGPALTTVVGQIGGAAGGVVAVRNFRKRMRHRWWRLAAFGLSGRVPQENNILDGVEEPVDARLQLPMRFGIRHLLWITLWLSLALTAIRLSGLPTEYVIPLVVGWAVYQAATLYVGSWIARRFRAWWDKRQVDSEAERAQNP